MNPIEKHKRNFAWPATLIAIVALAAVGAYSPVWTGPADAQQSACDASTFEQTYPQQVRLHENTESGQIILTWIGPGITDGDTETADCTWRNDADFEASRRNQHSSPSLHYTVERRASGESSYTTLNTIGHLYSADGLGTVKQQTYIDSDPPDGQVNYRVTADWNGRTNRHATLSYSGLARITQSFSSCADVTFNTLHPSRLRSRHSNNQVTLTWYGPGITPDSNIRAECTWRTPEDYSVASDAEFVSPSLTYEIQKHIATSNEWISISPFLPHQYNPTHHHSIPSQQTYTFTEAQDAENYRVFANWRGMTSYSASISAGNDDTDPPETITPTPEPSEAELVCFYRQDGEIHSIALPACTEQELQQALAPPTDQ